VALLVLLDAALGMGSALALAMDLAVWEAWVERRSSNTPSNNSHRRHGNLMTKPMSNHNRNHHGPSNALHC
jgi:hypothetical protein